MARALYGHLGSDPLLAIENARLRSRIAELEAELAQARSRTADEALERELTELTASTAALA